MNFKTTLLLLALLLAVSLSLWLLPKTVDNSSKQNAVDPAASRREGKALFTGSSALDPTAVDQITLQYPDQAEIVLQKQGSVWNQIHPVRFPLNDWKVSELLNQIADLRIVEQYTPSTGNLANTEVPSLEQVGLKKPLATITLSQSKNMARSVVLHLGRSLVGSRAYLMLQGNPLVMVVPNTLHTSVLDGKIADWRKRTLEVPSVGQLEEVELIHKNQTVQLLKRDGRWVFAPPLQGRVDAGAVQSLINTVTGLYIESFVADAPKDLSIYGLDHPITVLSLRPTAILPPDSSTAAPMTVPATQKTGTTYRFMVGAATIEGNKHFVALSNEAYPSAGLVIFQAPATEIEKLRKNADDLRDPHISIFPAGDLRQVQVHLAKQEIDSPHYTLLHSAEGWSFAQPGPEFRPDGESVSNLLKTLRDAKAVGYEPLVNNGELPLATFTLNAIGQSEPEVIGIFKGSQTSKDGQEIYRVLRGHESVYYQVPISQLTGAMKSAHALRDRTILDLKPEKIAGLTISQLSANVTFKFIHKLPAVDVSVSTQPATKSADTWELQGQERFEKSALDTLLAHLAPLRVAAWKSLQHQKDTEKVGTPDLRLDIQSLDGKIQTLAIWTQNRQAQMEGVPSFELEQGFIDSLKSEFRYRTLLPFAPGDIQSVTLITETKKITIRKNDQDQYISDSRQDVNQSKAAGIFDTLAGLRIERHLPVAKPVKPHLQVLVVLKDGRKIGINFPSRPANLNSFSLSGDLGTGEYELSAQTAKTLQTDPMDNTAIPEPHK